MNTVVPRRPKGPSDTTDRAAQAAVDATLDYSDEVTVEQMGVIERVLEPLKLATWKVKTGPAF